MNTDLDLLLRRTKALTEKKRGSLNKTYSSI